MSPAQQEKWWQRLGWIPAGSLKGQVLYIAMFMAVATVFNLVWAAVTLSWAPVLAALAGWVFVGVYAVARFALLDRGAGLSGKLLVPSGGSTPSVADHSQIQSMVMRGEYARAAEAYRAAILADPNDLAACDQLGQLASRELKDPELALFAYREGEKRAVGGRKAGYALLALGVHRDMRRDYGRAIVEVRRILAQYPDVPNAQALKAELEELKQLHFEGK